MKIYLTTTIAEKDIVKAAGAKYDPEVYKWWIDESQKSNPVFAKYLPKENQIMIDSDPNPDWGGTENEIWGMMNSDTPKPSNHIKTYPTPDPSSPEILESVIEEIAPATSTPEKPAKRTRGQIIDSEDSKIRKTYALNKEDIAGIDRLSKYFKLNLSDTISKLRKIGEQWLEENGKDAEIKKINNQNNQLIDAIQKTIAEQQKEIDTLKNALAKNSVADIKNTNTQDYQKIDERIDKKISDALKNNVAQIPQSTPINFEKIDERVDKKMTEALKKMDTNINTFRNFTQEWIEELDDRTGPMAVYFTEKGGWQTCIDKYTVLQNQGKTKSTQLPDVLKEGSK